MPQDSSSNAPSSAKTSAPPADPSSKAQTESEFLKRQSNDARAAISRAMRDVQHEIAQSADPRAWMKVHPWATLGVAAVAGFAAAAVAIPNEEQQALRRIA